MITFQSIMFVSLGFLTAVLLGFIIARFAVIRVTGMMETRGASHAP